MRQSGWCQWRLRGVSVINKSLQLHGGYGYSQEYAIERIYRDLRICPIYEGSTQVQQMVISGQMLKSL